MLVFETLFLFPDNQIIVIINITKNELGNLYPQKTKMKTLSLIVKSIAT